MLMKEKSLFDVISDVVITICVIIATCSILYMSCSHKAHMKDIDERLEQIEQMK